MRSFTSWPTGCPNHLRRGRRHPRVLGSTEAVRSFGRSAEPVPDRYPDEGRGGVAEGPAEDGRDHEGVPAPGHGHRRGRGGAAHVGVRGDHDLREVEAEQPARRPFPVIDVRVRGNPAGFHSTSGNRVAAVSADPKMQTFVFLDSKGQHLRSIFFKDVYKEQIKKLLEAEGKNSNK